MVWIKSCNDSFTLYSVVKSVMLSVQSSGPGGSWAQLALVRQQTMETTHTVGWDVSCICTHSQEVLHLCCCRSRLQAKQNDHRATSVSPWTNCIDPIDMWEYSLCQSCCKADTDPGAFIISTSSKTNLRRELITYHSVNRQRENVLVFFP